MKLEYKILWIDNDDKIYKDHQSIIEEHLTDLGFTPIIEKGADYQAFDKFESDLKQFDLFLLDYKLDGTQNGNEIIKNIRNDHSIYTDVIFYSTLPDEVRQRIYDDKLNGVYYTSRDFEQFEEDVQSIIDVTIKKTQDVNNLRGLIMAEVAELDIIKEEIIDKASKQINNKVLEKYVLKKIKSSGKSCTNQAQKHLDDISNITFDSLFEKIGFVDSNKKALTIGEALEKLNITNPVTKTSFTQPYIDNILTKRNKFAHVRERTRDDGNGNQCKFIDDIPFTESKCIEIRKEIKVYKKILEDIKNSI